MSNCCCTSSLVITIILFLTYSYSSHGLIFTKSNEKKEVIVGGIRWNNVSVSISKKKKFFGLLGGREQRRWKDGKNDDDDPKKRNRYLLQPSSGFVQNGHICAIIGPSGAGKSTLLAALSGTTSKGSGKIISGSIWIDSLNGGDDDTEADADADQNIQIKKSFLSVKNGDVALLSQSDTFFSMLTPRETLHLATFLQLGLDKGDRKRLVDQTLDKLGLRHVQSRRIGSPSIGESGNIKSGSLSGGERRRLSVALELVNNPMGFLADEPTTGLDSSQAQKVFNAIAKTTREYDIPCICSIHQPRASIWKELDSFILLAPGGKMIYMGKRTDAVSYFAFLGYECPPATTTAEFFIDLVTIDTEDKKLASTDIARIDYLAEAFKRHHKEEIDSKAYIPPQTKKLYKRLTTTTLSNHRHRRPFHARLKVLLLRSLRQNFRDINVNLIRAISSFGLAGLFSELFSGVKRGKSLAKSVADRTALLSFGVINMCMISVMKTLNLFGKERAVVAREQMRKQYSSFDYLLSKSIGEMPLDVLYSALFATSLKYFTCIRIPLSLLCGTFSLMTVASSSIGFAVGSVTSGVEEAMTVGMPIMVVLMAVGIINPSGVDPSVKTPLIIQFLKRVSPIGIAIEALCIAEYKGMDFGESEGQRWKLRDLPRMGGLALVRNGDQVIDALGLTNKSYGKVMKDLAKVSLVNLCFSWVGLSCCNTRFMNARDTSSSNDNRDDDDGDSDDEDKCDDDIETLEDHQQSKQSLSMNKKERKVMNAYFKSLKNI